MRALEAATLQIATQRLILAPLSVAHATALHPLLDDWDVVRMLSRVAWPVTIESVEGFAKERGRPNSGEEAFAILLGGQPIGTAGIKHPGSGDPPRKMPRLGYWIGRPHWGAGYATEAVAALVDHAFGKFAAREVGGGVFADNPGSRRVLEKLGFAHAGDFWSGCLSRGGEVLTHDMTISRGRWTARRR